MANISGQMDELFDDGLDFDVIFDNEDSLIDTVNGVNEDGSSKLGDEFEGLDEEFNALGESEVSIPGEPNTDDGKADNTAGKSALIARTTDTKNDVKDQKLTRDAESDGTPATPNSAEAQVDDMESPNEFRKDLGYTKEGAELSRIEECEVLYEATGDESYIDEIKGIVKESYAATRLAAPDVTDDVDGISEAEDLSAPDEPDTDDGKNDESANNAAAKTTMANGQNEQKPDDNTSVTVKEAFEEYRLGLEELEEGADESVLEASIQKKIRKAKKAVKKGQKKTKRALKKVDKIDKKAEKLKELTKKDIIKEEAEAWYNENEYEVNDYERSLIENFSNFVLEAIETDEDVVDEGFVDELEKEFFNESLFVEADGGEDDYEDDIINTVDKNSAKSDDLEYEVGEDDILIDDLLN